MAEESKKVNKWLAMKNKTDDGKSRYESNSYYYTYKIFPLQNRYTLNKMETILKRTVKDPKNYLPFMIYYKQIKTSTLIVKNRKDRKKYL